LNKISQMPRKLFRENFDIPQDFSEKADAYVAVTMVRDGRSSAVGMGQLNMAAGDRLVTANPMRLRAAIICRPLRVGSLGVKPQLLCV